MGIANANVATMVIDDINAEGGLLGRPLELHLEDSETTDSVGEAKARKLIEQDRVDVIFGGIYSSMRQAIKGPAVVEGKTLYVYPEQYEGQESDPLIFCTGPVPAQQIDPLIPWLMRKTGARKFYLPSADYIWPHVLNAQGPRGRHSPTVARSSARSTTRSTTWTTARRSTPSSRAARRSCSTPSFRLESVRSCRACMTPVSSSAAGSWSAPMSTRTCSTWCRPSWSRVCTAASTTTRTSGSVQPGPARQVQPAVPGWPQVRGRQRLHRPVPRAAAVAGGGQRSGLAQAGRRHRGARPRAHRRRARWAGRDGARAAPRADEHVHRPGRKRPVQDRRKPRRHRSARTQSRNRLST